VSLAEGDGAQLDPTTGMKTCGTKSSMSNGCINRVGKRKKERKRDPSPVTRASTAAMAETEAMTLVAELGGVEVCTCESKRDGQELLHGLSKASEEGGEEEGDVAAGDLAIDGRWVVRV
jgi:hypothetical protein